MWEDVHRLHANTQRFTCRTRASVDLGLRGPWNRPHEDTEDAAYTGADSRRRVRTQSVACRAPNPADRHVFSRSLHATEGRSRTLCAGVSSDASKGQSGGFARTGRVIYSVDRQGVTEG